MSESTKKILKGAAIAAAGAVLAYGADLASSGSLGVYSVFLGLLFSAGINALKVWATPPSETTDQGT